MQETLKERTTRIIAIDRQETGRKISTQEQATERTAFFLTQHSIDQLLQAKNYQEEITL